MMKSAPAKKAIKGYNKLAAVFVEYEMLYHQAWVAEVGMYVCMYEKMFEQLGIIFFQFHRSSLAKGV